MKKKKALIICLLSLMLSIVGVSAEEVYYTNSNNVQLTKQEYNFITIMFYEGFQETMTINDYNYIFSDDTINGKISKKHYEPYLGIQTYGTIHKTASKELTITTACSTNCFVTISAVWTKSPNVRSYDVIGAYLKNTDLVTVPNTVATNGTIANNSSEIVSDSNGFGVSVLLPSSGNNIKVSQYFRVNKGGTVYGSYQHAKKSISLSNSKKYTISRSGYGGVFLFKNGYSEYYDGMGGVSISV